MDPKRIFQVLAGVIALAALVGAGAIAIATRFSSVGLLSAGFLLLWTAFFGRIALTGRGLSDHPYEPSE